MTSVKPMGLTGEVLSLNGDKAELAVSGKRLKIATSDLVGLGGHAPSDKQQPQPRGHAGPQPTAGQPNAEPQGVWGGGAPPVQRKLAHAVRSSGATPLHRPPSSAGSVSYPTKQVPPELNLIGLTVEEASDRVSKLLDDAALSDRRELRLIHGFGEGKLRKAIARLLETHPLVASWRAGGPSEGGGGATVVELRD